MYQSNNRFIFRKKLFVAVFIAGLCSPTLWAEETKDNFSTQKIETYTGIAKKNDQLIYTEKHTVTYDQSGTLIKAFTDYINPDGSKLARIESDFTQSLTVPTHLIENYRTGNKQGIRRDGNQLILFDQDKDKPERTKVLEDKVEDRVLVGCQGLNYYLLGNMATVASKKSLPLRFLIPGKLDYYDFNLQFIKETSKKIFEFEVTVQSFFLRLFAPKLYVVYDGSNKHIVSYKGLSNITDDKGNLQDVSIIYSYDTAKN